MKGGALRAGTLDAISISALRCFVAVAEIESFTGAARQLRIAASSVSKNIQAIEHALGVAVVHRTTRKVTITEAGRAFHDHCLSILAKVDMAAHTVSQEHEISGHLRVRCAPSFATHMIAPHVHEFLAAYPSVSLDLVVSSAVTDLFRDRVDVAILLREEPESKVMCLHLGRFDKVLCASPGYIARRGAPTTPSSLLDHDCLTGRFSDTAEGWLFCKAAVTEKVEPNFRLLCDNGDLLRLAGLAGAGIGSFYRFHVLGDIAAGALVEVLPDYRLPSRQLLAMIPHHDIVLPKVDAFIRFLRGVLALEGAVAPA